MKSLFILALLISLAIVSSCDSNPQNGEAPSTGANNTPEAGIPAPDVDWEIYNGYADIFVTALAGGNFDTAISMFDETMAQLIGESELQELWNDIVFRAGEFISIHETVNSIVDGYYLCDVTSRHEKTGVTLGIVFSEDSLIAGLFIRDYPVIADSGSNNTQTVQRDGFTDIPVIIGEGTEFPLNGILTMPDNATGPVPAAVIVHGSGPQDMDLTIFGNKPYRDIAERLAANGIAVIRYNKRTLTYGAKIDGSWTVMEETIEDAILAAGLLKADPRIDAERVFIIGHSLGGMLAPRIHAGGGDFAGMIILAGSPRFLLDISKDQNILYINETMEGDDWSAAMAQIEELWDVQVAALVSLPDGTAKSTLVEAGMSAYYFKDLYNNPAYAILEGITIPILILQGDMDSTVQADIDFIMYKQLLNDRTNVDFKLYEGLNHLFMPSSIWGITRQTEDYAVEGLVDGLVLADIVNWIIQQ